MNKDKIVESNEIKARLDLIGRTKFAERFNVDKRVFDRLIELNYVSAEKIEDRFFIRLDLLTLQAQKDKRNKTIYRHVKALAKYTADIKRNRFTPGLYGLHNSKKKKYETFDDKLDREWREAHDITQQLSLFSK